MKEIPLTDGFLPIVGATDRLRRELVVQWFVKPVARRMMMLDDQIRCVFFALARLTDGTTVWTDYRFIGCSQPRVGWPIASSDRQNPLLAEGVSDAIAKAALKSLYGHERPSFDPAVFTRIFGPYTRDVHQASDPVARAFAPFIAMDYELLDPANWDSKRRVFALGMRTVGSVLAPELIGDETVPAPGDDPRVSMDGSELMEVLSDARSLQFEVDRLNTVLAAAVAHKANPTEDTLLQLRRALGIRDAVVPTNDA
jgi:hypothetical protein